MTEKKVEKDSENVGFRMKNEYRRDFEMARAKAGLRSVQAALEVAAMEWTIKVLQGNQPDGLSGDSMSPDAGQKALVEIEEHAKSITRAAAVVRAAMAGRGDQADRGKARAAKAVAIRQRA